MIVIDTHIWLWAVQGDPRFKEDLPRILEAHRDSGIGVSPFSCWEVAMLIAKKRVVLPYPAAEWIDAALAYPGVRLLDLTAPILVDSVNLPAPFHGDPADRIVVATARAYDVPLVTRDKKIEGYEHVRHL